MSKIDIEYIQIEYPKKIVVDGKSYPITKWNVDIVDEYRKTKDESCFENLKDFSLEM